MEIEFELLTETAAAGQEELFTELLVLIGKCVSDNEKVCIRYGNGYRQLLSNFDDYKIWVELCFPEALRT